MNGINGSIKVTHNIHLGHENIQAEFDALKGLPNWSISCPVWEGSAAPQALASLLRRVADTIEEHPDGHGPTTHLKIEQPAGVFVERETAERARAALINQPCFNVGPLQRTAVGTYFFFERETRTAVDRVEQVHALLDKALTEVE